MAQGTPPAGPLPRLGRYGLIKETAGSGVATTWVARTGEDAGARLVTILRLHRHITKKVELAEAFLNEARNAQKLKHPNVLQVLETGIADGEVFVVTDYVESETLANLFTNAGADGIPVPIVLRIALDVLEGLSAAHTREPPLVHGEVSPFHIRVGLDGVARVASFGIARALARLGTHGIKNHDRLSYGAPERVKAMAVAMSNPTPGPLDPRSDLFSVGTILWECFARQRLFTSKIEAAVIQKVLTAPIPPLSSFKHLELPEEVDEAVAKALERDPDQRYANAEDFIMALEGAGPDAIASTEKVGEFVERVASKAIGSRRDDLRSILAGRPERVSRPPPAPRARSMTLQGVAPFGEAAPAAPGRDETEAAAKQDSESVPPPPLGPSGLPALFEDEPSVDMPTEVYARAKKPRKPTLLGMPLDDPNGAPGAAGAAPAAPVAAATSDDASASGAKAAPSPAAPAEAGTTPLAEAMREAAAAAAPTAGAGAIEAPALGETPQGEAAALAAPEPIANAAPHPEDATAKVDVAPTLEATAPARPGDVADKGGPAAATPAAAKPAAREPKPFSKPLPRPPSKPDVTPMPRGGNGRPAAKPLAPIARSPGLGLQGASAAASKDAPKPLTRPPISERLQALRKSVPPPVPTAGRAPDAKARPLGPAAPIAKKAEGPPKPLEPPKRAEARTPSPSDARQLGPAGVAVEQIRPGTMLGQYEILAPIAKGGMANVWAARLQGSRGFQKIVAVKTMLPDVSDDPDFEKMFLDEARVAARIRHPNVAEILDVGEEKRVLYIVMEWIDGDTIGALQKAAKASGGIPQSIILRIASQICAGLHAAHELRDDAGTPLEVVHRDVSPANVLVAKNGFVKIVDFGIAKSRGRLHVTRVGSVVKGKTPYLSPEQLAGKAIDRRSDVFSFGVLLYVLATGLHPFRGDTDMKTVENIAVKDPAPPHDIAKGINPEFEAIILKALSKNPAKRFATAEEMQQAIDRVVQSVEKPATDEDVGAFVAKTIGAALAKRETDLRAALVAIDKASEPPPDEHDEITFDDAEPDVLELPALEAKPAARATPPPAAPARSEARASDLLATAAAVRARAGTDAPPVATADDVDARASDEPLEQPTADAAKRKRLQLVVGFGAAAAIVAVIALASGKSAPPSPPTRTSESPPVTATVATPAPPTATVAATPTAEPTATTPEPAPTADVAPAEPATKPSTSTKSTSQPASHSGTKSSTQPTAKPASKPATGTSKPKRKFNPTGI